MASGSDSIVQEFHDALQRSPNTAVAVAAIKVQRQIVIAAYALAVHRARHRYVVPDASQNTVAERIKLHIISP